MKKTLAKTPLVKLIPLLVRGVAPAAAIAFGAAPATTLSAPGDLDSSFGDLGRVGPIMDFSGTAWSAQPIGTDGTLIAGGDNCDYYCSYYHFNATTFSNFMEEFSGAGTPNTGFVPDEMKEVEIFNTALLADDSIIAVGRSLQHGATVLTVAKLSHTGALDASFASGGIFRLPAQDESHQATSVIVDPDGRIAVAGSQGNPDATLVVRLQSNGVIDNSFGTAGVYKGPATSFSDLGITLVGTGGGYRVSNSDCSIIGLTATGQVDPAFGIAGIANAHPGAAISCNSLVAQPDGRLLAFGYNGSKSYATRLLANGALDTGFTSSAIDAGLANATAAAVATDGSGSIVVAGTDPAGTGSAVVMRLQPSGQADTTFGRGGTSLIDLSSDLGSYPVVRSLVLRSDGSVIAAGGTLAAYAYDSDQPFVVRLQGAAGPAAPGVLSFVQASPTTNELSNQATIKVRRTGGAAGNVSVAYQTQPMDSNWPPATSAKDFTPVSGRLTWNDGDSAEQEIHVPILADNVVEESEYFNVALSDPQGGAGIGTRRANVEIQPDGSPYGQFEVGVDNPTVAEGQQVKVWVARNYYTSGEVSVTVTPTSGSASAGADFDPTPITVKFADGEGGAKAVMISIADDGRQETQESFSVQPFEPDRRRGAGTAILERGIHPRQ